MKIKYQLPAVYQRVLPKTLLEAAPEETIATCDNCRMSPQQKKKPPHYQAHLKCCTFYPYMPNYLVGGVIRDEAKLPESTRLSVNKIIDERQYALPVGFVAPVAYQVPFNKRKEGEFGNREDWLCPYFSKEGMNCGIWRWRGGVCTTFFCESSYGNKGLKFWAGLNDYLNYVEMALMEEALVHLDFSPRQVSDMLDYINRHEGTAQELKTWNLPLPLAKKLWNGYFDDQKGFYVKCLEIIEKLDRKAFSEALGEIGTRLEDQLQEKIEKAFK